MQSAAEEANYIPITDAALAQRLMGDFDGVYRAHYQLGASRQAGVDVYWVEKIGPKKSSWHTATVMNYGGLLWADCKCKWFEKHRSRKTVCAHILSAVMAYKERIYLESRQPVHRGHQSRRAAA